MKRLLIYICIVITFTVSCVKEPLILVTGISLDKTSVQLTEGESTELVAGISPSNADNKSIIWSSSDEAVATVSNGKVSALKAGSATISAKTVDGGYTASCSVLVNPETIPVTSVSLSKSVLSLNEGETETLIATVLPDNASDKTITWSSNNTSVVTVSSSGLVSAQSQGLATITVQTNDGAKTATCSVSVQSGTFIPVTGINLNETTLSLRVGDSHHLIATVTPLSATNKSVSWSSDNTSVATVSPSGEVTAKDVGTAIITVTTNDGGLSASCTITVQHGASFSRYLTFTSEGSTTLSLDNYGGNAPTVYYSYNKRDWTLWDYSGLVFSKDKPLYLCGNNINGFSINSEKRSSFDSTGSRYSVSGDIMSLLDYANPIQTVPYYCFHRLFIDNVLLVSAPDLPAIILDHYCYYEMFKDCSSLTKAPDLPATTLARSCYSEMFFGCSSLTVAPLLPATSLTSACYRLMFSNCSSLTVAPALPATTLEPLCYDRMFYGCSSLTTAPDLPATGIASSCYSYMFYGCSSLTKAPDLPAKNLANYCYSGMFYGCSSLTKAPDLPATKLTERCYDFMFCDCSSLTTAPDLPATKLTIACYDRMFMNCSNLRYIRCLAIDISASDCLWYWVEGVAKSGTFIKNNDMNDWPSGNCGIPKGWTVINN